MEVVQAGDIVTRESHGNDLYFVVVRAEPSEEVLLSGISHRLWADAPLSDLHAVKRDALFRFKEVFHGGISEQVEGILAGRKGALLETLEEALPGKVLHIDGDGDYLKMCLAYYKKLKIPAVGKQVQEKKQPEVLPDLLKEYPADILILTGHDALKRSGNAKERYKSSGYFAEAVKRARQFQSSKDALIIFAGACQSNYKEIMEAGANFASSPERIFIHALDPVFIAEKIAFATTEEVLSLSAAIENTITKEAGIGGISSRGTLRFLSPSLH